MRRIEPELCVCKDRSICLHFPGGFCPPVEKFAADRQRKSKHAFAMVERAKATSHRVPICRVPGVKNQAVDEFAFGPERNSICTPQISQVPTGLQIAQNRFGLRGAEVDLDKLLRFTEQLE